MTKRLKHKLTIFNRVEFLLAMRRVTRSIRDDVVEAICYVYGGRMGYYIETGERHNKAQTIIDHYHGEAVTFMQATKIMTESPKTQAVIVVVDNGPFEAAGFAFNADEFQYMTHKDDRRPKRFVVIPWALACQLTGYKGN